MVQAWTVCPICTAPPTFWECENISWCPLMFLSHKRWHVLLESGTWCPENWLCFEKFAQWLHIHVKKKWVVLVNKSKSWAIIPLLTSALYLRKESIVFEVVYNDCLFWAFPGCPTKVPDGDHRNHLSTSLCLEWADNLSASPRTHRSLLAMVIKRTRRVIASLIYKSCRCFKLKAWVFQWTTVMS